MFPKIYYKSLKDRLEKVKLFRDCGTTCTKFPIIKTK